MPDNAVRLVFLCWIPWRFSQAELRDQGPAADHLTVSYVLVLVILLRCICCTETINFQPPWVKKYFVVIDGLYSNE